MDIVSKHILNVYLHTHKLGKFSTLIKEASFSFSFFFTWYCLIQRLTTSQNAKSKGLWSAQPQMYHMYTRKAQETS